jgi:hypothetical protein
MTITRWKIAAVVVLFLAVGYRLSVQPPSGPTYEETVARRRAAKQEASDLLDRIRSAKSRMQQTSGVFNVAIMNALEADRADPKPVRDAHAATLELLRQLQQEWAALPRMSSEVSANLSGDYKVYLDWQEQVYANEFAGIVETIEDPRASKIERYNRVQSVLHEQFAAERPKNERQRKLLRALRSEFQILN